MTPWSAPARARRARIPASALVAIAVLAFAAAPAALAAEIEGEIAFPGSYVPPMIAYAYEIDAAKLRKMPVDQDQRKFVFRLPPGHYLLFLAPNEPGAPNIYGAYTEHSRCEERAYDAKMARGTAPAARSACDDHRLATIHLRASTRPAVVKIDDWYLSDATSDELDHIRGLAAAFDQGPLGAPRFSEYAIAVSQETTVPKADLAAIPSTADERRTIGESLARGPNFSGHVTIIRTRCGVGCEHLLLLDWRSDKISQPPELTIQAALPCRSADAVQFRRDSRLLSVTRMRDGEILTDYYLWRPVAASIALLAQYRRTVQRFCAGDAP